MSTKELGAVMRSIGGNSGNPPKINSIKFRIISYRGGVGGND